MERKPYPVIEGLRNIQRLMKIRNPALDKLKVEDLIDDRILRGLEASGSSDGDPMSFAWNLDNNGSFETAGQTPTFSAAGRDGPDTQTIGLKVCDSLGACSTASSSVTINNVGPSVGPITAPINPVPVNTAVNATASFTDAGTPDTHTGQWTWGDGNSNAGTVT